MSTYLLTATPAHGHIMPLLVLARHLVGAGHRVRFLTSERYRDRITEAGADFIALPADADVDLNDPDGAFPGRAGLRGPAALRFDITNLFLRPGGAQLRALDAVLAEGPVDAILTEPLFVGAAMLRERPRNQRPPIVALGIFPLGMKSRDIAPFGLGIPPMRGPLNRPRNAALTFFAEKVVFGPVVRESVETFTAAVGHGPSTYFLDWMSRADAVVQFTVPGFEYPRALPEHVHFVGPLPSPAAADIPLPSWWHHLDGSKPIVHVTQGTVANADLEQLIVPTIVGLAASDVVVVVATGGRALSALPNPLPANVFAAEYLPYDRLLPITDVVVTNGGYGGVQLALGQGIPLVVAGQTEDKVEVSARVGWSGVGVNLKTNRPRAVKVRDAVERVLSDGSYRAAASRISEEMAEADALAGLDRVLVGLEREAAALR